MTAMPEALREPIEKVLGIIKKNWTSLAAHERECIKFWCGLYWPTELVVAEFRRLRVLAELATEARDENFPLQSKHVTLALGLHAEKVPLAAIVATLKAAGT